jgi:hypothetical protein
LLGDGTGVVIGIVDSGVDDTHPALTGFDSLGSPRLVAERNFVTSEPANTGDDVFGHGTWVSSVALSSDPFYTGLAPDARYVNARVLDQNAGFGSDVQVRNGIGYAIERGANVLNLSLNFFAPTNNGFSQLDLMIDWAAYERGVITAAAAGNISGGTGTTSVRGPGSAFNGITVGRTIGDYSKVSIDSAGAFTSDGRLKPDIVAPGTLLTLANDDWEGDAPDWEDNHNGILLNGTSFATPHVAGMVAQQLEAGMTHGLSRDPLVVKATLLNSASKDVLDRDFNPWQPAELQNVAGVTSTTHPLDPHSGAGQIDGQALAKQYLAGEMLPGLVGDVGWDLSSVGHGQSIDYVIDPALIRGTSLTATLTWHRHVGRTDNGNGIIDALDTFTQLMPLNNLNLQILRDGILVAQSASSVDNVEHLLLPIDAFGRYTLRVLGANVLGGNEKFALAWHGVAVPEPATLMLALLAAAGAIMRRRR